MEPSAPPTRAGRGRYSWVPFFLVLAVLAALAATLPVVYNLRQQLRPEQLQAARERWRQNGPNSYDLEYTIRHDRDIVAERYLVLVRDGQPVFAGREGEPTYLAEPARVAVGALAGGLDERLPAQDIDAIFGHIESVLWQEQESEKRNYLTAIFDATDGHPLRFVYRVRSTNQREEWNVLLSPPGQAGRSGKLVR